MLDSCVPSLHGTVGNRGRRRRHHTSSRKQRERERGVDLPISSRSSNLHIFFFVDLPSLLWRCRVSSSPSFSSSSSILVMNLVRVFQPKRRQKGGGGSSAGGSESTTTRRGGPVLRRCNAMRYVDYDAWTIDPDGPFPGDSGRGCEGRLTRSLDFPTAAAPGSVLPSVHFSSQTSFRISGEVEGEFDSLCNSLGLSGPDDFAITPDDWAAAGGTPVSDAALLGSQAPPFALDAIDRGAAAVEQGWKLPLLEEQRLPPPPPPQEEDGRDAMPDGFQFEVAVSSTVLEPVGRSHVSEHVVRRRNGGGGIKGARPSPLAPPPPMSLPVLNKASSTWDIFRSLAPDDGQQVSGATYQRRESFSESEEDREPVEEGDADSMGDNAELEEDKWSRMGVTSTDLTPSCSFWTSNDEDSSSTTTEGVSPNGKLRRDIRSWDKGQLLGSGSFGTVYEAMSDDGFFFAVKEVYLLDEGTNAQQCINQLEQEIALLSQFEHENIVQYLGTAKEEAKLCIFLELVSQGSLASLYQKYHLRDSQVSAYTRQILNGLRYLHDRNVVHRDIKCANMLVSANGSVKLADFGLAKKISQLSDLKSCKGSVYWMAPEVVIPGRTYGPPADIWSLGCAVLEMSTQKHPFPNLEWTQALFHIGRGGQPPIPHSLSRDARDFIQQCTQVDPDDRPSAYKLFDHPFVKRPLLTANSDSTLT
uniref:mitogen-activated protein kinase kinase kinase n=1 Tax=Anthurium amnicola TaxID=1678845 RepID=A0A1D1XER3_9ARAE